MTYKLKTKIYYRVALAVLFFWFVFLGYTGLVIAETKFELRPNEKWVIEQIEKGKIADLNKFSPNEKDRVIRIDYLEKLLMEKLNIKIPRQGIMIVNAIFNDPVEFHNIDIEHEVKLMNCLFRKRLNLNNSIFHKNLRFNRSKFLKKANFNSIKVERNFFINNAIFEGAVDFGYVKIGGNLVANRTKFNNPNKKAIFVVMKVKHNAFFHNTTFEGAFDIKLAEIGGNFEANGAKFNNPAEKADFSSMEVEHSTLLNNTTFMGEVDITHAKIGWNFETTGATFNSPDKVANFNGMEVIHGAFFQNTTFEGAVYFTHAKIGRNFEATGAKFNSSDKEANFNSMEVKHSAFFNNATFKGAVNFGGAEIGSSFIGDDAKFLNPDKVVYFSNIKVKDSAIFKNTTFDGGVNFVGARIDSQFVTNCAKFNNPDKNANFSSMNIGQSLFNKTIFKGCVDLRNIKVDYAEFIETIFDESKCIFLQGMTYQYINTGSYQKNLQFVKRATYYPGNYQTLESFFERIGESELADDTFVAQKRRERKGKYLSPSFYGSWFMEIFIYHGRKPSLALGWSLFILFIGSLVFRKKNMQATQAGKELLEDNREIYYNSIWYSLDTFLPFIALRTAKAWTPISKCARIWMRTQILLGYILVPIALLAITGAIK